MGCAGMNDPARTAAVGIRREDTRTGKDGMVLDEVPGVSTMTCRGVRRVKRACWLLGAGWGAEGEGRRASEVEGGPSSS